MSNLKQNPYYEVEKTLENFLDYTEYDLSIFKDRIVERPRRFIVHDNGIDPETGNKIVTLEYNEGEVIQDGTDLSEMYLGNMDVAIAILFRHMQKLREMLLTVMLKLEGFELDGGVENSYTVTFSDLTDIKIIRGYWDKSKGEVLS